MGNSQSSSLLEKQPYLVISPYPLVSVVRKPARTVLASTSISTSKINAMPCVGNTGVTENDHCRECRVCIYNREEESGQQQLISGENNQQNNRLDQDGCSYMLCSDQMCELQTCDIRASPSSQQLECSPVARPSVQIIHILNSENTSEPLHHLLDTKATLHPSLNGCNECLNQGGISDSYSRQHYTRESKFIQDIKHTKEESQQNFADLSVQVSLAEPAQDELTEADRNLEFHEGSLVERGGICGPPDRKWNDCRMTRQRLVEAQREDSRSEGLTGQCEVVGGSTASNAGNLDNRLPTISDPRVRNYAFSGTRTWDTTATNEGNLDNRLSTILEQPIRNDTFSETRTWDTTATNAVNLDNRLPTISNQPVRTDTFSDTTTGGPQVYIDHITGEHHSMVFGSFAGEGTSIVHGSGTFPQTQRIHSVMGGYFENSIGTSFGTECFSNVASRDSFHNSNSDFEPKDGCHAFIGRAGPFDSFNDNDLGFSGVQVHDEHTVKAFCCKDACEHCNVSQNINLGDLHFPVTCSVQPDNGQQTPHRIMRVISHCESCDSTGESSLEHRFGNSGFVCESCTYLSQSLAANTSFFMATPSSELKSQCSHDSWSASSPGSCIMQTTGHCFVDYNDDSQDLYNSQDNSIKHSCSGYQNKIGSDIKGRCVGSPSRHMEVEECEIATEDFGIDGKPHSAQPTKLFGQDIFTLSTKTIESQFMAESKIRGTDTEEFNIIHITSSDRMWCPIETNRSDSSLCSGGNRQQHSNGTNPDFSDESADSKHHSINFASNFSFNNSLSAKDCNTEKKEFEVNLLEDKHHGANLSEDKHHGINLSEDKHHGINLSEDKHHGINLSEDKQHGINLSEDKQHGINLSEDKQHGINLSEDKHHDRKLTIPSVVNDTIRVDGPDNGYIHDNGTRPKVCNMERRNYRERVDRAGPAEGRNGENGPCLMHHSGLFSCDCSNPFKQNYSAYLCCAPDDLSKFGLTFHATLEKWGYRIFIAPRDLELTGPKYDNMTRWLEERCNGKIIVILSINYGKSEECLFLTYFARTLDPDARNRNIIPVKIDRNVEIPNILKGLSIIKYNYDSRLGWLKKRLADAIAA